MTIPPRDPHTMSDGDLSAWVLDLIGRQTPESHTLDYKRTITLDTRHQKLELAKDVSSFANETGGILIYGIPQDETGDAPIPGPLSECGISIPASLAEKVENILIETVDPPLPELYIRAVPLVDNPDRMVLVVYHPASWNRPHMTLYEDGRYYRRGSFRAVLMREREVEALYGARRAAGDAAREFFTSADFGAVPDDSAMRIAIFPRFSLVRREAMREREFVEWLDLNPPGGRRGGWGPFLDGWRFVSYAKGPGGGNEFEVRLFHSGAVSATVPIALMATGPQLRLRYVEQFLNDYVFASANKAFDVLRITWTADDSRVAL